MLLPVKRFTISGGAAQEDIPQVEVQKNGRCLLVEKAKEIIHFRAADTTIFYHSDYKWYFHISSLRG